MKSSHTASQMDRLSAPGGTRFHIAVYNYERIHSFINNFHRIRNFNPDLDRIVVWDCSKKFQDQERQLREFCKREGFSFGEHVIILSRRNYGIDQGARLDYFNALLHMKQPPRYIWQFQDHYLDLDASFSWWPAHEKSKPYLKTDTIPDGVV